MELKNFGIHVILIEPGVIKTEFQDVMMDSTVKDPLEPLMKKKLRALKKATQEMYARGIGSPPSTITKLIIKAINSHNPKRRYVGGLFAKPMLLIKKWFGDKIYEKAIMSQIKKLKKNKKGKLLDLLQKNSLFFLLHFFLLHPKFQLQPYCFSNEFKS